MSQLQNHLYNKCPKYILALDGGGVRGILSLGLLEKIEELLASHYGKGVAFRLCDHFSLIGGTSTGSIIASALACGYSVKELLAIYMELAHKAFGKKQMFGKLLQPKFSSKHLMALIQDHFNGVSLGSDNIRCGLGIIAKRLDTHSVWVFHNHPNGPFFDNGDDLSFTANKDLPLANIIRASTAAPSYFEPEYIQIAPGVEGTFVDGGASPHNNPSLAMFMLATMHGYGFRWPSGIENLHVTSVGTGKIHPKVKGFVSKSTPAAKVALDSLISLLEDNASLVQTMMQWMGKGTGFPALDGEIGTLQSEFLSGAPLFKYQRYNAIIERQWLIDNLGVDFSEDALVRIAQMDNPKVVEELLHIGRECAERQVQLEDLLL